MKALFKSLLTVLAVSAISVGLSMHAFADKKQKTHKPSWCCTASGEVVMEKGKKLCVKSKEAPKASDKMHKKAIKSCEAANGSWEEQQPAGKAAKPTETKPEAMPPAPSGEPTEEVPIEK